MTETTRTQRARSRAAIFALAALLPMAGLGLQACKTGGAWADGDGRLAAADDAGGDGAAVVDFTILQMNDIYEINPVEGGHRGGLARVATLRQRLLAENPQTLTVLDGDLISPSAMGVTTVDGQLVAGAQMVDTLNALGLDYATIGNHEFDLGEAPLVARIAQSKFKWVSSNVTDAAGQLYPGVVRDASVTFHNAAGAQVRVGLFGVTVEMVKKPFVLYAHPLATAEEETAKLAAANEIVVGLTHVSAAEDQEIAAAIPRLDIQLGGHEHEHMALSGAGRPAPTIFKADANARTVYVHRFHFDTAARKLRVESQLVDIDATIPEDPTTAAVAKGWTDRVFAALRATGIEPEGVVGIAKEALDGRESAVRNHPTSLTALIGAALLRAEPEADAAVYGSGSIRVDDVLPPGNITQFDILRIFPFGGKTVLTAMRGSTLRKALAQSELNKGSGGYLLYAAIDRDAATGVWRVKGEPLDDARTYRVLVGDFLLTGQEKGLAFLNPEYEGAGLAAVRDSKDVRVALSEGLHADLPSR